MSRYRVPPNCGKVRVMMYLGGKYAVWNGKDKRNDELLILCRDRAHAEELANIINKKLHDGEIEVHG